MPVNSQGSSIRTETNINGAWIDGDCLGAVAYQFNNQSREREQEIKENIKELAELQQKELEQLTAPEIDPELQAAVEADLRQRNVRNFPS